MFNHANIILDIKIFSNKLFINKYRTLFYFTSIACKLIFFKLRYKITK